MEAAILHILGLSRFPSQMSGKGASCATDLQTCLGVLLVHGAARGIAQAGGRPAAGQGVSALQTSSCIGRWLDEMLWDHQTLYR